MAEDAALADRDRQGYNSRSIAHDKCRRLLGVQTSESPTLFGDIDLRIVEPDGPFGGDGSQMADHFFRVIGRGRAHDGRKGI